jgi:uroporphyrin-III C-methyltransferase
MPSPISVILAAHGSEASPESNQPLHELAAKVAALGLFDNVTPAFLLGQPLMSNVLRDLPPGEAIVVPVMTSDGYYLKKLPGKFRENPNHDQFRISFSPVAGLHPAVATEMSRRLTDYLAQHQLSTSQTTVVVVGHGTRRNTTSGANTFALADALSNLHPALNIKVGFLDQDPELERVADSIQTPNIIILPFLVSRGPHMVEDVPSAFGLPSGNDIQFPLIQARTIDGRSGIVICDGPMATFDQFPNIIAEMAQCRKTCGQPDDKCSKNCFARCSVGRVQRTITAQPDDGCVYLIGAGPGDPELITVRGMKLLQRADVVVYDRLIPLEVLQWCSSTAEKIDVGKFPEHHRVSQSDINDLIVEHALDGKTVVRLKGGDPFVFGRGTEEIEACQAAGVTVRVVPGVSSAIAGPAAAGIPVTSRGVARSFMVVTGQTAPELAQNKLDFEAMAKTDTVVLMMARKNLRSISEQMIAAGRNPETPVACIERATFEDQRVTYSTLHGVADQVDLLEIRNPMITVIGAVAAMVDPKLIDWPGESKDHFYALEFGE